MPSEEKRRELTKQLLVRLTALGATAWETPRMNNGMPTVNAVMDGDYYGFYPSIVEHGGGLDIKPFERAFMERLQKAGAVCEIVANVRNMEKAMGLDVMDRELKRLLPRRKLVELLRQWGKGQPVPPELGLEILSLAKGQKDTIYALYFDRMTANAFAEQEGITLIAVKNRHKKALNALRDRLVRKHNIVDDKVIVEK